MLCQYQSLIFNKRVLSGLHDMLQKMAIRHWHWLRKNIKRFFLTLVLELLVFFNDSRGKKISDFRKNSSAGSRRSYPWKTAQKFPEITNN